MTVIAPGFYAVLDPDDDHRMTYWSVDSRGAVRDFPHGARWRPLPPEGMPRQDRRDWYDHEYRDWLAERDQAIADDPAAAAARFRARYPNPGAVPSPPPEPARKRPTTPRPDAVKAARERALRDAQALIVAALRAAGHSFRTIADLLGVPLATVHRRAERGRTLAETTTRDLTGQLADSLQRLGRLLDADGQAAMRAAAAALFQRPWTSPNRSTLGRFPREPAESAFPMETAEQSPGVPVAADPTDRRSPHE